MKMCTWFTYSHGNVQSVLIKCCSKYLNQINEMGKEGELCLGGGVACTA